MEAGCGEFSPSAPSGRDANVADPRRIGCQPVPACRRTAGGLGAFRPQRCSQPILREAPGRTIMHQRAFAVAFALGMSLAGSASALVTRPTQLQDMLTEATFILVVKVESLDEKRPAMALSV